MAIDVTKKPKISLSKVVLEKSGDSHRVNLSKNNEQITINLNWTQKKNAGLFANLFNKNQDIDLDLGCYYELNNGEASVIDGLQFSHNRGGAKNQRTRQGCYTQAPWIWHCGDDRGSGSQSGENILVNPNGAEAIRRIIVYCFIYDGIAKWGESDAVVTVKVPGQPDIVVEMGRQTDPRTFCAIASIEFNGRQMSVRKEITFHNDHKGCDRYYGWGFNWGAGSK
ncbi:MULTISPECIES: stress protein [unclassified Pasteurella]|uniref:stress protein n=1 Tax=unclassified Pasteurella TaxID=2621516 RepID=UPI001073E061|nr:stress protein [Pasteurella sp. 19428wF3_WM03]TFU50300.1 stress protein [Pasteurella sp. WM03]